jgi:hypothetical protein
VKSIKKPVAIPILIFCLITCSVAFIAFLYPVYLNLEHHIIAEDVLREVAEARVAGKDDVVAEKLNNLRDTTGLYFFNDFELLSDEEFFSAVMTARIMTVLEWQRLFTLGIGFLAWYIIFVLLVSALVASLWYYETKGWSVRRMFKSG